MKNRDITQRRFFFKISLQIRILLFWQLLSISVQVCGEHPQFKYHYPPPEKHEFPAITEFFGYGIYAVTPYPYQEMWNRKHLNRTTDQAYERHYRHLILNNFNYFHHNLFSLKPLEKDLLLSEKYGGKQEFHLFCGHLTESYNRTRWPLEKVVKRMTDFLKPYADNPHILCWRIFDEIGGYQPHEQQYVFTLKDKIYEFDQLHPITFVEQGGPTPITSKLEYGIDECYSFYGVQSSGKDLSHPENFIKKNWEHFQHQTVRECILWAAGYGVYNPTPEDVRAQVFHMLAGGQNSLSFYYGPIKAPAWANWDKNDFLAKKIKTYKLQDYGLCNNFEYEPDFFKEAAKLGGKIIPLGYLFLKGQYEPESIYITEGETAQLDRAFSDPETGVWKVGKKEESALGLGVWKQKDADLLVVYNRDLAHPRSGFVNLKTLSSNRKVYDLFTFTEIPVKNNKFPVKLETSGGGLYLLTDDNAFFRHKKEILRRKFEHEANKLRIRIKIARGTQLLDLSTIDQQFDVAKKVFNQKEYLKAWELFKQTKEAFEKICLANNNFKMITFYLREASDTLWKIDLCLKEQLYSLMAEPENMGGWEYTPPLGVGRPALEAILKNVRNLSSQYYPLAIAFESGKQTDPKVFKIFVENLKKTYQKLGKYRTSAGPKTRIAFLVFDNNYDRDAWNFLRLHLPNCELLKLKPDGRFVNINKKPTTLSDFDVIWFHYVHPRGKAFLDTGKKIPIPEVLTNQGVIHLFQDFLSSGKGILLTGLAPAFICRLGIETEEPNTIEIDRSGFVIDGFKSTLYYQAIGLKSSFDYRRHPLFKNLEDNLFFCADYANRKSNRCTWTYPVIPKNGNVLAWETTKVNPPPDKLHYDLIEYAYKNKGRVITCSLPKLDLSTKFKRTPKNITHYRNLVKFMRNMFAYLGCPEHGDFRLQPLTGPFYHTDLAKFENNPLLKIKVSSGTREKAPFDKRTGAFYKWDTQKTPAWVEIDFGSEVEIQKIHISNNWISHTSWTVQQFRIKTWDEKIKKFSDIKPAISYDTDNARKSYEGITLTFEPIKTKDEFNLRLTPLKTRKILIEDIDGVYFNDAKSKERKGISISNIIIYGRKL